MTIRPVQAESALATLTIEDPVVAYPNGCLIDVTWTIRRFPDQAAYEALTAALARTSRGRRASPGDPAVPLVAVSHNGRRTTNHDVRPSFSDAEPTAELALMHFSSNWVPYAKHSLTRVRFWLWPVPMEEPIELAVEWRAAHVRRATTTIDGRAVMRAARTSAANFDRKDHTPE